MSKKSVMSVKRREAEGRRNVERNTNLTIESRIGIRVMDLRFRSVQIRRRHRIECYISRPLDTILLSWLLWLRPEIRIRRRVPIFTTVHIHCSGIPTTRVMIQAAYRPRLLHRVDRCSLDIGAMMVELAYIFRVKGNDLLLELLNASALAHTEPNEHANEDESHESAKSKDDARRDLVVHEGGCGTGFLR